MFILQFFFFSVFILQIMCVTHDCVCHGLRVCMCEGFRRQADKVLNPLYNGFRRQADKVLNPLYNGFRREGVNSLNIKNPPAM